MRKVRRWNISMILVLYLAMKPLYLFESGGLQICDIFLIIASAVFVLTEKGKLRNRSTDSGVIRAFLIILLYQLAINLTWFAITGKQDLLRRSSYYIFNYGVFWLSGIIVCKVGFEETKKAVAEGVFLGAVVMMIGALVANGWGGSRKSGFFNNPNQLGYFCLLLVTFVVLFPDQFTKFRKWAIILMACWCTVQSSSKAVFFGMAVTGFLYVLLVRENQSKKALILNLLLIAGISASLYLILFSEARFVTSNKMILLLRKRIMTSASESDNELYSGRGYGRIAEMGVTFLWGMGEGAYERFQIMKGVEANTTFATLIVSYGVVGMLGYCYLFWRIISGQGVKTSINRIACLSGVLVYFVTHNALRNTFLWIILAMIAFEKDNQNRKTNGVAAIGTIQNQHYYSPL